MYFALMSEGQSRLMLERKKIGEFMEPPKKESFHENLRFRFVRGLAVCSAVISPLLLISCPSAFARVRIIANSAVVERINKVYQEKIDKWKKILGSSGTSQVVAIEKFDGNFIKFESSQIEVLKNIQGDTDENTMLWIPGQRILISGDVLFNGMHVYTAETDSKARGKWLNSLERIRELKPSVVIPGHSKVGAPLDAGTAADFTENYLLVFEEELKKAKDPDSLVNAMKEKFPSTDLLLAIERGAKANVERRQTN